jgi:acylphosphatase
MRANVRGLVQGVGYRYFVRRNAVRLGLDGWVKNLPDGSVEVLAQGNPDRVRVLIGELREGPQHADVTGVEVNWDEPHDDLSGFEYGF